MPPHVASVASLGDFLKRCRTRLDPASFGFSGRRRTPGLRREEVAQRAHISPTWYTWLEQGRGGAPSPEVLDRIAGALMLTEPEREHLFMLGLGRPPEVRYRPVEGVNPRLQRLLDSLQYSPAIIKTATWDVVAWNRAAAIVLTDYSKLPPGQRNILRFLFCNPDVRAKQHDWEAVARFVVGAFRADVARAGLVSAVGELVDELCSLSPEFDALWRSHEVHDQSEAHGVKRLHHPTLGLVEMEQSAFAVDGRPDLHMLVYNPLGAETNARIRVLIEAAASAESSPDSSTETSTSDDATHMTAEPGVR
ncbi:helix-turn-helix transcriptional regulator [Paraburkholderia tropica]|uniref:helix-turn-helix transcriptional regulator n=1 Tax=Paraburkholderia tropica TaxID=92647 RepID=UPI000F52F45B|nr:MULTISPECIES: helix-turn-helix transcriptional regulator [Paraburkholderia]RQM45260.1 XRE family transcriptional regulator [Paraburkholderia bannensis]